ncbi:MAG: VWA domain-containing protein [Planctomycetes bacterium]|nr:VWA domain-containing protein [Planctomycetota bacterium]
MRRVLATLALTALTFSALTMGAGAAPLKKKEFNKLKKHVKIAQARGDASLLAEKLGALAADDSKRAVDLVLKVAMGATQSRAKIYTAATETLGKMTSAEATAAICAYATKKKTPPLIKILAIEVLGQRADTTSAAALGEVLKDGRPEILRAALKAIKTRRAGECVDGLLNLLERLGKRPDALILADTREALVEITGKWFDSIEDWRKWWAYSKHAGKREVTGSTKELLATAERKQAPPKFFGTEIKSERVVFVIDVSGSMKGTRLAKSKKQLIQCIGALRRGSSFTVSSYSSQVRIWNRKLQPATQRNKGKAISFVETLRAQGNTCTLEGLTRAFDTTGADTIVLLSDGAPTGTRKNGERWTEAEILEEVAGTNKVRQWRIHTFGFGAAGRNLVQFMKDLASKNDGKFTQID